MNASTTALLECEGSVFSRSSIAVRDLLLRECDDKCMGLVSIVGIGILLMVMLVMRSYLLE